MLLLTNNYVVTISITEQPTEKLIGLFKETSNILNFHSSDLTVKLIDDTHMEKLFYAIQYKNGCLAASDLFHMFTQSPKLYIFHYPV